MDTAITGGFRWRQLACGAALFSSVSCAAPDSGYDGSTDDPGATDAFGTVQAKFVARQWPADANPPGFNRFHAIGLPDIPADSDFYSKHRSKRFDGKRFGKGHPPDADTEPPVLPEECLASPSPETCCTAEQTVVLGTPHRDRFNFSHRKRARCVFTFEGKDSVATGRNDDLVHGGEGPDHIETGAGDDVIFGAEASDRIFASFGQDAVDAGDGNDFVDAGPGNDVVEGGAGNDRLFGSAGDDSVNPGQGKDRVWGGRGDDTVTILDLCEVEAGELLDGGRGNDRLVTPVPVEELEGLGVQIRDFEEVVVQSGSCESSCAVVPDCSGRGSCVNGDAPSEVSCDCDDGFSGDNCQFEFLLASAGGFEYNKQCSDAGVPLPPVWNYEDAFHGLNGTQWTRVDILPLPFISGELTAEVFFADSDNPPGVCIALPRSVMDDALIPRDDGIHLLGVICQGTMSSKACFWDAKVVDRFETMIFETEDTPVAEQCEIVGGFPDTQYGLGVGSTRYHTAAGSSCFIGGTDLELPGASGGTCTECHRGENAFIVPDIGSALGAVPQRTPSDWHNPIVDPSWPQNPGPFTFDASVPTGAPDLCMTCHGPDARGSVLFGGRFPIAEEFCFIAEEAFATTMPPGSRRCDSGGMVNYCDPGLVCQNDICVNPCGTAGECQQGEACTLDTDCANTLLCRNSACVPTCSVDADCGVAEVCRGLACVPSSYADAFFDECP